MLTESQRTQPPLPSPSAVKVNPIWIATPKSCEGDTSLDYHPKSYEGDTILDCHSPSPVKVIPVWIATLSCEGDTSLDCHPQVL